MPDDSAPTRPALERALVVGVLALLAWAPLPLGSNREWSAALLVVLVAGLVLLWGVLLLREPMPRNRALRPGLVLFGLLLMAQAWVAAQWAFGLSVHPGETVRYLVLGLAYSFLFLLVIALFYTRKRLIYVLSVLVISGVLQAFYGAVMVLSGVEWLFAVPKESGRGVVTGTFVNRNHLAGYLEMTLAAGIGLMLALRTGQPMDWRSLFELLLGAKARLRLALIVMVIALVMSASRGGNVGFLVALVAVGTVFVLRFPRNRGRNVLILASIIVIDVLVISHFFGLERLRDRLMGTEVSVTLQMVQPVQEPGLQGLEPGGVSGLGTGVVPGAGAGPETGALLRARPAGEELRLVFDINDLRGQIFTQTVPLAQERLWTGHGAGSYETVFVARSGPGVGSRVDHAHNDYLQFWAEFGLIGTLPLALFVLAALGFALRALWNRDSLFRSGVGFGAAMAIVAILIHSWSDFNLQIPANAATFIALCAVAVLAPLHDAPRRSHASTSGRTQRHLRHARTRTTPPAYA
jgi:O-antigen ligase